MKRLGIAILLLALLTGIASAEDDLMVWAGKYDDCYHYDKDCGEPDEARYYLSEMAAKKLLKKQPCPECMLSAAVAAAATPEPSPTPAPEAKKTIPKITCAKRSGTWVFRFPAALLESVEMGESEAPETSTALARIFGENLSGVLDVTLAVPADGTRPLSLRIIDGDAYFVVRPDSSYKKGDPLQWVAEHFAVDIFNPGQFTVTGVSEVMEFAPSGVGSLDKLFTKYFNDVDVVVYSGSKMYVALVSFDHFGDNSRVGIMRIGDSDIPVEGTKYGKQMVFFLALTEDEADSLRKTAPVYYGMDDDIPPLEPSPTPLIEETDEPSEDAFQPVATLPPDLFDELPQR